MTEEREIKRIRQACQNCRRKKTRCSGEKPVCAFCARLKQECCYDNGPVLGESADLTLATRVALLESKLSLLNNAAIDFGAPLDSEPPGNTGRKPSSASGTRPSERHPSLVGPDRDGNDEQQTRGGKFAALPPLPIVISLTETYFQYCHNQPYCYFVESVFRRRLQDGDLPSYLLMAVVAMAARYSQDSFFEGMQEIAIETYSRSAWDEIFKKSFSDDDALDITVVQATNLLAVVDFTSGKHKLAWVKIGLSVRFAQSLQLAYEPPEGLTREQQEERVLTFWSVYLLDRLVSCGNNRPPTIADSDCSVRLPLNDSGFAVDSDLDALTLQALQEVPPDADTTSKLSNFAYTILMASALGRVGRFSLQKHDSSDPLPPWHDRSEYTKIHSLLMTFETYFDATGVPFSEALDRWYTSAGWVDQPGAGHFIFSVLLFNMNQCLLNHPFLLRNHLNFCKTKVPPSFLKDTLRRGREHAQNLTMVLRVVQKRNLPLASFYAYACTVAGTIHKLYIHHDDNRISNIARKLFEYSVDFLNHGQDVWKHYPRMASALIQFDPDPAAAKSLVTRSATAMSPSDWMKDPEIDIVWNMLDYGWLSESARLASPERFQPWLNTGSWDTEYSNTDNNQSTQIMDGFMQQGLTGKVSMDCFNPAERDTAHGAWSEIIDESQTVVSVDLDAERDWFDLVL